MDSFPPKYVEPIGPMIGVPGKAIRGGWTIPPGNRIFLVLITIGVIGILLGVGSFILATLASQLISGIFLLTLLGGLGLTNVLMARSLRRGPLLVISKDAVWLQGENGERKHQVDFARCGRFRVLPNRYLNRIIYDDAEKPVRHYFWHGDPQEKFESLYAIDDEDLVRLLNEFRNARLLEEKSSRDTGY